MKNPMILKQQELENHAFYKSQYAKLNKKEKQFILSYIDLHKDVDRQLLIVATNMLFITTFRDHEDIRPKQKCTIQELLSIIVKAQDENLHA